MVWMVFHCLDVLLWLVVAISVGYCAFFALASVFRPRRSLKAPSSPQNRFLVLFPAYHEDGVIFDSVQHFLAQDYPADNYQVVVISDHMQPETNRQLADYPITLLTPTFEKSSKAKAMQHAISHCADAYDYVVVLDADNIVQPDFLQQLNLLCNAGFEAIQCHRCAKNADNDVAVLDGASEEINNSLFRRAHNQVGLSSALIGSGMCFRYGLFAENVFRLTTAGEDRELEALLLEQKVFIKYADHIHVHDEKVSSRDNFQRQRMRWMTAQVQSLMRMLPHVPNALVTANFNYLDKTLQQALIPRSMLLVLIAVVALLLTIVAPASSVKWWLLLAVLIVSLVVALPAALRSRALLRNVVTIPSLVWRMISNLLHIDRKNTDFIHTQHGGESK